MCVATVRFAPVLHDPGAMPPPPAQSPATVPNIATETAAMAEPGQFTVSGWPSGPTPQSGPEDVNFGILAISSSRYEALYVWHGTRLWGDTVLRNPGGKLSNSTER